MMKRVFHSKENANINASTLKNPETSSENRMLKESSSKSRLFDVTMGTYDGADIR